jgi:hypothetical protein
MGMSFIKRLCANEENKMNLILTLIIPLFITAIPLIFLQVFGRPQSANSSIGATLTITGLATLLGMITPFLAASFCAVNLAGPNTKDELHCVPISIVYLPLGYIITLATLFLGIYYSIIIKKRSKTAPNPNIG